MNEWIQLAFWVQQPRHKYPGASFPPKSMMHVSYYLPYFQKIYKFPYFAKFLNFLPTFIKFTIYGVIHIFCASP